MNQRKSQVCAVLIGIMFCCVGCGLKQTDESGDAGQITTGAAVYVDGNENSEEVKHQLEILVKHAEKWRIAGDDKDTDNSEIQYTVTDLDHNGRLEILAREENTEDEKSVTLACYEVNSSGDGIESIATDQAGEDFLANLVLEFNTTEADKAYFDPKTGEYHYVIQEFKDEYRGEEENCRNIISAITLKGGQITKDTLGYQTTLNNEGKKENRWYRVDGEGKTEIEQEEYSGENLGDTVYSKYGKMSVQISTFRFLHSLDEMTEEQMYHILEKSYQEFLAFQGYPLEKQTMLVYGHEIAIPQYTTMQDLGKQKRINQMIYDWVNQGLNGSYSALWDLELDVDITIKYAGRDRVSLLLEATGYAAGAAHANESCDTITLDLEQEKVLTGNDIVPVKYQEWVEEDILDGFCKDFHGGKYYRKDVKDREGNLLQTQAAQGWQDAKIYQTKDDVGVVIPVKGQGLDAYVYYEVYCSWANSWQMDGIAYPDVDWEAYRYQLLAPEYQRLQEYMPVLTGEMDFTWEWSEWTKDDKMITKRKKGSISQVFKWVGKEFDETYQTPEDYILSYILLGDLTQNGEMELILHFPTYSGFYLILHQEGEQFYGTWCGEREFQGVRTDGVYTASGGARASYYYRMRFEGDTFVEELIGRRIGEDYYINGKEVTEKKFIQWYESVWDEPLCWYVPEALQEEGGESGQ